MIFGKTAEQRHTIRNKKRRKKISWHSWFAWYPALMEDGRVVWMKLVERRRVKSGSRDAEFRWEIRTFSLSNEYGNDIT